MCATVVLDAGPTEVAVPGFAGNRPGALLALGLWAGITYGDLEALEVVLLSLVPGALSWRSGNSLDALWFAPLFYGTVFLLLALPLAALARHTRRVPWDSALVFLYVAIGGFFGFTLREGIFSDLSAILLALGIAAELTHQYRRRPALFQRFFRRSLPVFAAVPLLAAPLLLGGRWLREKQQLARILPAQAARPNVLLLVLDAERADHLSMYGYERPTTPQLDAFAREGMTFLNAYSPSSWTLPSHASMFTGRQLHEHGAGLMRRPYLDDHYLTLAEALTRAGYATAGFAGNTFWVGRQTGLERGFIHFEDFYQNPGDAAIRTSLGRRTAFEVLPRIGFPDIPGRRSAADLDAALLHWVDALGGKPFFVFVNYLDVHGPHIPPAPYRGRFTTSTATGGIGAITGDIVAPPARKLRELMDRHDESLLYLDAQLGQLFQDLRTRGLLDKTIVVVTSDHGESWGEHGLIYHGHSLYLDQLHIPLVIRYPARVAAGSVERRPVSTLGLASTIARLTLLPADDFPGPSLLLDSPGAPRPPVVAELGRRSLLPLNWPSSRGWQTALITEQWHLIRSAGDTLQLFDVRQDRQEGQDRAKEAGLAPVRAALQRELSALAPARRLEWYGWKH